MSEEARMADTSVAPIWGELRYSAELARLLADARLRDPRPVADAPPVLLIPGFMAGDASLAVMRSWLTRRGHRVQMSGMLANVDCAGRAVERLQGRLVEFVEECGRPVALIGQSRGGALARSLAVRQPESVCALAMLGSPVRDGLAASPRVLRTVRVLAWLGDLGVPGLFSSDCRDGVCCEAFDADLHAPLASGIEAVSVYSRSDGVVDWRACVDPYAESVEIDSSHCGMSVHPAVYRVLEHTLAQDGTSLRAVA
jgi:triacylglycerol lipase